MNWCSSRYFGGDPTSVVRRGGGWMLAGHGESIVGRGDMSGERIILVMESQSLELFFFCNQDTQTASG